MRAIPFGAMCSGVLFAGLIGCNRAPALSANDAAKVESYDDALAKCRAKGKASNSLAVYETCAAEADRAAGRRTP